MSRGYAAIGLVNPKNPINVGSVLRAAYCYGARLIAIQGRRYRRRSSDTTAAHRHIPLLHDLEDIFTAIPYDCIPIAVEIVPQARSLFTYTHPERAFYIFGPEDSSLGKSVLSRVKDIVFIPTRTCLNLAQTVNVVLYDRRMKAKK